MPWKTRLVLRSCVLPAAAFAALVLAGVPAAGQVAKRGSHTLDDLAFSRPELAPMPRLSPSAEAASCATEESFAAYQEFLAGEGSGWRAVYDASSGLPALLEGKGIPWLPGTASGLLPPAGLPESGERAAAWRSGELEARARGFLNRYPGLLGARSEDLLFNASASGSFSDYLDYAEFQWGYHGIPVEGARVLFRLNHGNLVQVGQENVGPAIRALDPRPALDLETAWQILWSYVGGRAGGDDAAEEGRLLVVPTAAAVSAGPIPRPGVGLAYRLVYRLAFRRPGVPGTWEGTVDAHTGEVVSFRDAERYGRVRGGAYVSNQPSVEQTRPFPYADFGGGYADGKGAFSGSASGSKLDGKFINISDLCGPIDLSAAGGDLDFGKSGGPDCVTPGTGGGGNTRAARTQYYMLNQARAKAASYLPNNAWLGSKVTANVNIRQTCNANWNGQSLNFYASGGGCGNTGELPGTSLHEWGHGLDQNDGNGSSDLGTGEAYGDLTATMLLHESCQANGFFTSGNCGGYGNACLACKGVRELDYAKHRFPTPATSSQLAAPYGFHCYPSSTYAGPCGYEGHCESAIASQAVWDLVARDLPASGVDQATAWQLVEAYWFLSRPTASSAYRCDKNLATDGCGSGNLYSVFRAVDDCDGDLSNGTPHGEALYAAMNRHGIACPDANHSDQACCAPLATPALLASASAGGAALSWPPVSGAGGFSLYRSENGCDAGSVRIAKLPGTATSYFDEDLPEGVTYSYRLQAFGSSTACAGPVSPCAPVATGLYVDIAAEPNPGSPPLEAVLKAQAGGGEPPYTYSWDFGDGGAGSGESVTHRFEALGTYGATATVTDAALRTAETSVTVRVVPPPSIGAIQGKGNPYKLLISGTEFHPGCEVEINGEPVMTVWKSATLIQAKNCKYYLPKGRPVMITVTNRDENITSPPFTFTR